jgi:hypothetical protein
LSLNKPWNGFVPLPAFAARQVKSQPEADEEVCLQTQYTLPVIKVLSGCRLKNKGLERRSWAIPSTSVRFVSMLGMDAT